MESQAFAAEDAEKNAENAEKSEDYLRRRDRE
jgi:hypothetical protein